MGYSLTCLVLYRNANIKRFIAFVRLYLKIGELVPTVSVRDINIYYELHGKGTPLVLIKVFYGHYSI